MSERLKVYPDWMMQSAEAVLGLIESDFGQNDRYVQLEAIRCELWAAHERGLKSVNIPVLPAPTEIDTPEA